MRPITEPLPIGRESAAGPSPLPKEQRAPWPWQSTWPFAMLMVVSIFNYLDRSLLGLALPAIKAEMGVSDTALGLVSGVAFIVIYSLMGLPIAWAADRFNRRTIISIGLAFWSAVTLATGWVTNIWQLAFARFCLGAGEASSTAPANSMIADLFHPTRRPLALAIYGVAATISHIVLFPVAGWIAETYGWRAMFIAAGVPGIVAALVFRLTVREPARTAARPAHSRSPIAAIRTDVRALLANRCYAWMLLGMTFMGSNIWATGSWTPTFFQRVHGLTMAEAATIIGPSRGFLGAAGILLGGLLVDRLRKSQLRWRVGIPALACLAIGPAELLFLLGEETAIWVLGFAGASFFTLLHQGPIYAAVVNVVAPDQRALAIAMLLLGGGLVGNIIGPTAVGILNDVLAADFGQSAIRYSLLLIAITPLCAGACFWQASGLYVRNANEEG
ncbi:MFS family permease [Sphingobium sp. B1D7B]|uniref:spinster family MFS transporter n=1 Tax=unclassified Sphingobium TaxID=2611147 RepID=UPI002225ADDE|nr:MULTISPECIES: MFS transporter [unclassified Sphingobium]MCW2391886.1 MFS family permease [Sphingobium sp. B11D3A]MCW2403641.1 MFS family permease [Sphingobium sp. B1D7B]